MTARTGFRQCSRCLRNRQLRFFKGKRGRVCTTCQKKARSDASHRARVQSLYGLEPGEYDQLFTYQGGTCAICGQSRKQRLSVDHCHKSGAVRGLLCRLCNGRLLTAARDRPEVLRRAAEYLEDPPAIALLGVRTANNQEEDP